jgi:hypothetical protein
MNEEAPGCFSKEAKASLRKFCASIRGKLKRSPLTPLKGLASGHSILI